MTDKLSKANEKFGAALYQAALESREKKMTEQVVIQVEHWMQNKHAAEIVIRKQQAWVKELEFKLDEIEAGRFEIDPGDGTLTLHRKYTETA